MSNKEPYSFFAISRKTEYELASQEAIFDNWRKVFHVFHGDDWQINRGVYELTEAKIGVLYGPWGETELEKYVGLAVGRKEDPIISSRLMEEWYRLVDEVERLYDQHDWALKLKSSLARRWLMNISEITHPYVQAREIGIMAGAIYQIEDEFEDEYFRDLISEGAFGARMFMHMTIPDLSNFERVYGHGNKTDPNDLEENAYAFESLLTFIRYAVNIGYGNSVKDLVEHLAGIALDNKFDPSKIHGSVASSLLRFMTDFDFDSRIIKPLAERYESAAEAITSGQNGRDWLLAAAIYAKLKDHKGRNPNISLVKRKAGVQKIDYALSKWQMIGDPEASEATILGIIEYALTYGHLKTIRGLFPDFMTKILSMNPEAKKEEIERVWNGCWYTSARKFMMMGIPDFLESEEVEWYIKKGFADRDLGLLMQAVNSFNQMPQNENQPNEDPNASSLHAESDQRQLGKLFNMIVDRVNVLMKRSTLDAESALALYEVLIPYGGKTFPSKVF